MEPLIEREQHTHNKLECDKAKAWMNFPESRITFEYDKLDGTAVSERAYLEIYALLVANVAESQKHFRKHPQDPDFINYSEIEKDGEIIGVKISLKSHSTSYTLKNTEEKTIIFNSPKQTKRALQVLKAYGYTKDTVHLDNTPRVKDEQGNTISHGNKVPHKYSYAHFGEVSTTEELMMKIGEKMTPKKVVVTISTEYQDFVNAANNTTGWDSCYKSYGMYHGTPIFLSRTKEAVMVDWKDKESSKKLGRRLFIVGEDYIATTYKNYGSTLEGLEEKIVEKLETLLGRNKGVKKEYPKYKTVQRISFINQVEDGAKKYYIDNISKIYAQNPSSISDIKLSINEEINDTMVYCAFCEGREMVYENGMCDKCLSKKEIPDQSKSYRLMGDKEDELKRFKKEQEEKNRTCSFCLTVKESEKDLGKTTNNNKICTACVEENNYVKLDGEDLFTLKELTKECTCCNKIKRKKDYPRVQNSEGLFEDAEECMDCFNTDLKYTFLHTSNSYVENKNIYTCLFTDFEYSKLTHPQKKVKVRKLKKNGHLGKTTITETVAKINAGNDNKYILLQDGTYTLRGLCKPVYNIDGLRQYYIPIKEVGRGPEVVGITPGLMGSVFENQEALDHYIENYA